MQSQLRKLEKTWDSSNVEWHTALEASRVVDNLKQEARKLNFNSDMNKLLKNAEHLVGLLGSAEVRARQLHKPYLANKPREELKNAIDYCDKMLLILRLTQ